MENEEQKPQSNLVEFENKVKEKQKPKQNPVLSILFGVLILAMIILGYQIGWSGGGHVKTFFGCAMMMIGLILFIGVIIY